MVRLRAFSSSGLAVTGSKIWITHEIRKKQAGFRDIAKVLNQVQALLSI
ncbi:MAG: hypothetical protein SAK29_01860 [Scytonema sp. PMC 1069.18]|nr:hypothetical protein [Scytonema sp. PMC 1069.18]MEC4882095.1 hypothetical protein [Scytonema sp. PMC 1070.18]